MKAMTRIWAGLTAALLLLAAGCTAGKPQRMPAPGATPGSPPPSLGEVAPVPGPTTRPGHAGTVGASVPTTVDCAAALGFAALVRPAPPGGSTALRGPAGPAGTVVPGPNTTPGTPAAHPAVPAYGLLLGNVVVAAIPTPDETTVPAAPNTPARLPSPGVTRLPAPPAPALPDGSVTPGGIAVGGGPVGRIRTACPNVAEIRIVNSPDDRARMVQIVQAVRGGSPAHSYTAEIQNIAARATRAGGSLGAGAPNPGSVPSPAITTTPAPGSVPRVPPNPPNGGPPAPGTPSPRTQPIPPGPTSARPPVGRVHGGPTSSLR